MTLPAGSLFLRAWMVRVNDVEISESSLDVEFAIERTIHSSTNKCAVVVYNLNARHRGELTRLHKMHTRIRVEVFAGYRDVAMPLIFRGDLRSYSEHKEGGDYVSQIEGNDGGRSVLTARVSQSYPPGTHVSVVLRDLSLALGVGQGNISELDNATLRSRATFPDGVVTYGAAWTELTRLLRGTGLTVSIQNGALQFLRHGHAVQNTSLELGPTTGLLNVVPGDHHSYVATCLMVPDIYPGRFLHLDGKTVQGYFRANTVKWKGATAPGGDWSVEATCKALHTSVP